MKSQNSSIVSCLNCGNLVRSFPSRPKKYCCHHCYIQHTTKPIEELFWSHVDTSRGPDACWPWTAATNTNGHGQFHRKDGTPVGAHVFAYELRYGPVPDGLHVLHNCPEVDDPICMNHIYAGTPRQNVLDSYAKGSRKVGVEHHWAGQIENNVGAKLTWGKVREMRSYLTDHSRADTAKKFGMSPAQVRNIDLNLCWKE
jgi:hypothetical protein